MVIEILNISNLSNQDIIKILKVDVSFFPTLLLVFSQVNTNWGKLHQKRALYFPHIALFVEEMYSKKIIMELSKLFSQIIYIESRVGHT